MAKKKMKTYSLSELKDKYIGKSGTDERDSYEYELRMELIGRMIRNVRQQKQMTQEELGKLVGVGKAQISKLENSANSARIETLLKVFHALNAEIHFSIKVSQQYIQLP